MSNHISGKSNLLSKPKVYYANSKVKTASLVLVEAITIPESLHHYFPSIIFLLPGSISFSEDKRKNSLFMLPRENKDNFICNYTSISGNNIVLIPVPCVFVKKLTGWKRDQFELVIHRLLN